MSGKVDRRFYSIDGSRLREMRREAIMTQRELAAASGVENITISNIENGHRHGVRAGTLRGLAEALNAEPEELLAES